MDTEEVDKILWRFVVWTDFKQIHGGYGTESGAGGKHISLPAGNHEEVADFFDIPYHQHKDEPIEHEIELEPVNEIPSSELSITLRCTPTRERGGEWMIADQHQNRYELWKPKYGFPEFSDFDSNEDYKNSHPPIIYFIKDTDSRFHGRAVYKSNSDNLSEFPDKIRTEWSQASTHNNTGIIDFNQSQL